MSFWDPYYDANATEPEVEIPEFTEDDLKVALTNYICQSSQSTIPVDNVFELKGYEAKDSYEDLEKVNWCMYNLKVRFTVDDKNHSVKMVLKMMNNGYNNCHTHCTNSTLCFRQFFMKEAVFYGCVIPAMREYLSSHLPDLPVPECYFVRSNEADLRPTTKISPCCFLSSTVDVIMLEDLQDYRPYNTFFDVDHLKLAVQSLAQLHALSLVLDRRGHSYNTSFAEMYPLLTQETLYNKQVNVDWHDKFVTGIEIFSVLGPMMNKDLLLKKRDLPKVARVMVTRLWDIVEDCMKPSDTHVNTLCVNTTDINSFLFSYDNKGNPQDCKIVNFQTAKYASPIVDVIQVMFNCSQLDTSVPENVKYIIEFYHERFLDTLYKSHVRYHPFLPLPSGLLSLAELSETYRRCKVVGYARRAIVSSFSCLLMHLNPPHSVQHEMNVRYSAEDLIAFRKLPCRQDIKTRAREAFLESPLYRTIMYKNMGALLECLAESINCELIQVHRECPHPNPQ